MRDEKARRVIDASNLKEFGLAGLLAKKNDQKISFI
jgi:hypothetical protein